MKTNTLTRTGGAVLAASFATLALAACGGGETTTTAPKEDAQTVAQACAVAEKALGDEVTESLTSLGGGMGDLDELSEAYIEVKDSLEASLEEINNPEVLEVYQPVADSFIAIADIGIDTDFTDMEAASAASEKMFMLLDDAQTAGAELGALCGED